MIQATELAQLPQLNDHYIIGSSRYGDYLYLPEGQYDDVFLEAAEDGFAHGLLHDEGHLAINKATNKLVFLLTVRLEDDDILTDGHLAYITQQYAVPARILVVSVEATANPALYPSYRVVAVQLDRVEQLADVPVISSLIYTLIAP